MRKCVPSIFKRTLFMCGVVWFFTMSVLEALSVDMGSRLAVSSMRTLGMGGAAVAVSVDEDVLYRNPAGLSRVESLDIDTFRFRFGMNQAVLDSLSVFEDIAQDELNQTVRLDLISDLIPAQYRMDLSMAPIVSSVMGTGWGVGIYNNVSMEMSVKNYVDPNVSFSLSADMMGLVGLSTSLNGMFSDWVVGVSMGVYSKSFLLDSDTGESQFEWDSTEFLEFLDGEETVSVAQASATGWGANLGVLAPMEWAGATGYWGLSVNNLGVQLQANRAIDGDRTIDVPINATIGFGLMTPFPLIGDVLVAADYRFVSEEKDFFLNTHFGLEKRLWGGLVLRGGLNRGFVVGGITWNLGSFMRLAYVNTTDEWGSYLGENVITQQIVQVEFFL